jgi:hypothetical protein
MSDEKKHLPNGFWKQVKERLGNYNVLYRVPDALPCVWILSRGIAYKGALIARDDEDIMEIDLSGFDLDADWRKSLTCYPFDVIGQTEDAE